MSIMCIFPDFFVFQGYTILPLLPISFPVVWICLNLYGTARIQVLFTQLKEKEDVSISIWLKKEQKYTIGVECGRIHGSPFSKAG